MVRSLFGEWFGTYDWSHKRRMVEGLAGK
jgi:hypothetical protein